MKNVILFMSFVTVSLFGCTKTAPELPEAVEAAVPGKVETANATQNQLVGKWINVSNVRTQKDGTVKVFAATPGNFFNFVNNTKLRFSNSLLGANDNATYAIADGKVSIQYTSLGGSVDGNGVIAVPYTYNFPLVFDKDGLWVISFEDASGNKTVLKYKLQ